MPQRKKYPIPVIPSGKLGRNLDLAHRAAWDLFKSPYFIGERGEQAKKTFQEIFHLICKAQKLHNEITEIVLDPRGKKDETS